MTIPSLSPAPSATSSPFLLQQTQNMELSQPACGNGNSQECCPRRCKLRNGQIIDRKGKKKLPIVTEGLQELRVDPWPSKALDAARIVEFGSAVLPPSCTKTSVQTENENFFLQTHLIAFQFWHFCHYWISKASHGND